MVRMESFKLKRLFKNEANNKKSDSLEECGHALIERGIDKPFSYSPGKNV
jgi:hypothetical protein